MQPLVRIELSPPQDRSVKILAGGDFCLWMPASASALRDGPEGLLAPELLVACRSSDICSVNLECPLFASDEPIIKAGPALVGHQAVASLLKTAGVNVAVLANNHILDYGPGAAIKTSELCRREGIQPVGVGPDLETAERPIIVEAGDLRVAVLALAEQEFSTAGTRSAGSAKLDLVRAHRLIGEARRDADIVIVNVHGGNEFYFAPSPRMQSWYRFLVDCGAHAVIGHHPHVVQGMEIYRGSPIFYSLGNLLFEYSGRLPPAWYVGLLAQLQVSRGGVQSVEILAVRQNVADGQIRLEPLADGLKSRFEQRFRRLSQIAADPELVSQFWRCFALERGGGNLTRLKAAAGVTRGRLMSLIKLGIKYGGPHYFAAALAHVLGRRATRRSLRQQEAMVLLNLFRCPAHHEVITSVLEMELDGSGAEAAVWDEYQELMKDCR
ncbi:MAG: hypothetical protein AMXMBFR13_47720 [Phycisphaerae bacterium]